VDHLISERKNSVGVVVKGSMSSLMPCTLGVPQGSVLGPALFSLYTSPIKRLMHRHGSLNSAYADDVNVYSAIRASNTHTWPAANAVQALHDWYIRNGLLPNPAKLEVMTVGTLFTWQNSSDRLLSMSRVLVSSAKNRSCPWEYLLTPLQSTPQRHYSRLQLPSAGHSDTSDQLSTSRKQLWQLEGYRSLSPRLLQCPAIWDI